MRGSMKTKAFIAVGLLILTPFPSPADGTEAFPKAVADIKAYDAGLDALRDKGTPEQNVSAYLDACRQGTWLLQAKVDSQAGDVKTAINAFGAFRDARREAAKALSGAQNGHPAVVGENELYLARISPYLDADFYSRKRAEVELFQRKYFDEDDPNTSNLLEGWINGRAGWLRYSETAPDGWHRSHGVSAWEATFRVEPIVMFDGEETAGALLALGWLYNFFPAISPSENGGINIRDSFASKWLRRTGVRAGAGVDFADDPRFIGGFGAQVRAWTLWTVYSERESEWYAAIGLSDWEWLKPYLPWFGDKGD